MAYYALLIMNFSTGYHIMLIIHYLSTKQVIYAFYIIVQIIPVNSTLYIIKWDDEKPAYSEVWWYDKKYENSSYRKLPHDAAIGWHSGCLAPYAFSYG